MIFGAEETAVGFDLVFEFRPNPHFTNTNLTKRYVIDVHPDHNDYVIAPHHDVASSDLLQEWDADCEGEIQFSFCVVSLSSSSVLQIVKPIVWKAACYVSIVTWTSC